MIGFSIMAILNQEPEKIESVFDDISASIERSISDFDRSHGNSVTKKQASNALSKIYTLMAPVEENCTKYREFIEILSNGTDAQIDELDIQHDDVEKLHKQISKLDYGVSRLLYAFFVAESNKAWKPHLSTLMTMKKHTIDTLIEYKRLTMGVATLGAQYLPLSYEDPEEFSVDELAAFRKSVDDNHIRLGMEPPEWKTA
ncbi:hypothetical protein ACFQI0_001740 [Salmonella enterica]